MHVFCTNYFKLGPVGAGSNLSGNCTLAAAIFLILQRGDLGMDFNRPSMTNFTFILSLMKQYNFETKLM